MTFVWWKGAVVAPSCFAVLPCGGGRASPSQGTRAMPVCISDENRAEGQELRIWMMTLESSAKVSARDVLQAISSLNCVQRLAPGGHLPLRIVWKLANSSGDMGGWRQGYQSAACRV